MLIISILYVYIFDNLMEFLFDVNLVLPDSITIVSSSDVADWSNLHLPNNARQNQKYEHLSTIIDEMGIASAKAQKLKVPITSFLKFKCSNHRLYLMKDCNSVAGLLKVGVKQLFLCDEKETLHECHPLCVLDFYIHESKQRNGNGKKLFQKMLENENVSVHQLAIDRPSQKMLAFLSKHFLLKNPINQINKFVVFKDFFLNLAVTKESENNRRRSAPVLRNQTFTCKDMQQPSTASLSFIHDSSSQTKGAQAKKFLYRNNDSVIPKKNTDFYTNKINIHKDIFRPGVFSRHSFGENDLAGLRNPKQVTNKSASLETKVVSHGIRDEHSAFLSVASVDSPEINQVKKNKYVNSDGNYIVSNNNSHQKEYGTSWNVLGVPTKNYAYKSQFR
ncbi:alpha-tubulin N-acetyltransferase 2 isoform X3 [Hydra vulgaris]|uniref:Alpha-tubulin N-acetyltransferase n=2 Tax=Hydra vulgaris TaxID=6087 RepID=A0ABM4BG14_HYDVU